MRFKIIVLIMCLVMVPCAFAVPVSQDVSNNAKTDSTMIVDEYKNFVDSNDVGRIASYNTVQVIKNSAGVLHTLNTTSADKTGTLANYQRTITLYDSESGTSGNLIATVNPSQEVTWIFDAKFKDGIVVDKKGSSDVVVTYR